MNYFLEKGRPDLAVFALCRQYHQKPWTFKDDELLEAISLSCLANSDAFAYLLLCVTLQRIPLSSDLGPVLDLIKLKYSVSDGRDRHQIENYLLGKFSDLLERDQSSWWFSPEETPVKNAEFNNVIPIRKRA